MSDINLTVPFLLSQQLCGLLKKSNGKIINISSIYGIVAPDLSIYDGTDLGNPAAYASSKAGLIQLTKWLSTVLSPEIRVNSISLGGVYRNHSDIFEKNYSKRTPMGRMANTEDIIGAIIFLSTNMSDYVTGQNIIVDGGFTVW